VSPIEDPVIAGLRSSHPPQPGPDGTRFQWLSTPASLRVIAAIGGPVTVIFEAISAEIPRWVSFGAARRQVSTTPTAIRLCVHAANPGTATLPISSHPAPRRLPGGDPRVAGIGIYHLRAESGCR
jgi:hypothetical protein